MMSVCCNHYFVSTTCSDFYKLVWWKSTTRITDALRLAKENAQVLCKIFKKKGAQPRNFYTSGHNLSLWIKALASLAMLPVGVLHGGFRGIIPGTSKFFLQVISP